jgi:hypothetical protein
MPRTQAWPSNNIEILSGMVLRRKPAVYGDRTAY